MGISTLPQPLHFACSLGMFPEEASVAMVTAMHPSLLEGLQAEPLTRVLGFTW